MLFVWGSRAYGAVKKVGAVQVKTRFGHLWYLPLFPMTSFYVSDDDKFALELKGLDWRSVAMAYVRVWAPVVAIGAAFGMVAANKHDSFDLTGLALVVLGLALMIMSYGYDRRHIDADEAGVRALMHKHFGRAVDPFACLDSLQSEIDARQAGGSGLLLETLWHEKVLRDPFAATRSVELAILRARCDQHDAPLQGLALRRLGDAAPAAMQAA